MSVGRSVTGYRSSLAIDLTPVRSPWVPEPGEMLAQVVGSADHKGMKENPADAWTLAEIRREFARYSELVNGSDLAPSSKTTYLQHADRFVRWLGGEVEIRPGQRPSR